MKLQESEEILLEVQPDKKLLVIWFFSRSIWLGLFGGGVGYGLSLAFTVIHEFRTDTDHEFSFTALTVAVVIGFASLILAHIYFMYLRRTYVYTITNHRCIFRGGILHRVVHSVPYHKITDVEMSQYIIERILGISTLGIYTPGTGSMGSSGAGGRRPEIAFVGLKDNETPAELINEMLSKFKATGE
ncbi:MAG: PH domain-containing protein [Planctomycetota bacterium]